MLSYIYIRLGAVVIAFLVFGITKYYFHVSSDNPIEVVAIEIVKDESGIDLSQSLPEITKEVVTEVESYKK